MNYLTSKQALSVRHYGSKASMSDPGIGKLGKPTPLLQKQQQKKARLKHRALQKPQLNPLLNPRIQIPEMQLLWPLCEEWAREAHLKSATALLILKLRTIAPML
jgi:hypothetical protein